MLAVEMIIVSMLGRGRTRSPRRRHVVCFAALVALGASSLPAPAVGATTSSLETAVGLGAMAGLRDTAQQLQRGSLGAAVRAGAALADVSVASPHAMLGKQALPVITGVPAALGAPVAELTRAVSVAGDEAMASFAVPLRDVDRLDRRIQRLSLRTRPGVHDVRGADVRRLARLEATERSWVDLDRLSAAGVLVADAIDHALPRLTAYAATLPAVRREVTGCDVLDAAPVLCIGGTGNNTYTTDLGLLVDLGGDDLYRNSAGGAFPLGNLLAASVNIDVAGNDRYEAVSPMASGAASVQGGSNYGIGVLVDQAGNDSYSVTTVCNACLTGVTAAGQGFTALGVGLMADLAGDDSYLLDAVGGRGATASGQGYGGLGLAVALDYGGGADRHTLHASSCWACMSRTEGFGFARVGGAAISYDDGGKDTFSLLAETAPLSPDDPDSIYQPYISALSYGMGYGDDGGAAVHITGPGDTVRSGVADTASAHAGTVSVLGFGFADSSGSFGAVQDAGGNDSYVMTARSRTATSSQIDDSCGCDGVVSDAIGNWASVAGLGSTALGGIAVLRDMAGDDRYEATADTLAEAAARDTRSAGVAGDQDASASAVTGSAEVQVQGVGVGGFGVLQDEAGNDIYAATATSSAHAEATSNLPGRAHSTATAGSTRTIAQGVGVLGFGELRDDGGNDVYRTRNASDATGDETSAGPSESVVQAMMIGSGGNALLLDQGGNADVFTSVPAAQKPCRGERGGDMWTGCGTGAAVGINR